MGDMADMMLDGTLCAECGVFIDDEEEGYDGADGIPRYCYDCGGKPEMNGQRPAPNIRHKRKKRKRNR